MIIGLHGEIGAGKDTVCEMMRYLMYKYCTEYTFDDWAANGAASDWKNVKISKRLKEIVSMLTGYSIEQIEDRLLKDAPIKGWGNDAVTLRTVMNEVGTGIARKLNPNVWIFSTFANYTNDDKWIVSDIRFPNEADYIRNKGGIIIDIRREISYSTVDYSHLTETAMREYEYDYIIENRGSLDDLLKNVRTALYKIYNNTGMEIFSKRTYRNTQDTGITLDDWYHILDNNIFDMYNSDAFWGKSGGVSLDNAYATPMLDADCVFVYPK